MLTRPEGWSGGAASADYKPVLHTFVTRPTELLHITVETDTGEREKIVGTAPHPFYVERVRGFVPASDLQIGDRLSLPEGRSASVLSIRHERAASGSTFTTYNFEVAEHHTYFVGNAGVWVHNTAATPCQFAAAKFEKALVKHGGDALKAADESFDFLKKFVRRKGMSDEVLMRHLNDVVREINANHGVPMPDLIRMRHRKLGIGNTLGPEWDIDVFSNKFSWRKYLEETSGSKQDFLNETWETAELKYGKGKVHTHHIAMKKGLGEAGKAAVDRTHEMLINLGIDPIFDRENLAFLPKGGHPDDYAIAVEKAIKEVIDNSLGQAGAKRKLREVAEQWARKHKWKPGH